MEREYGFPGAPRGGLARHTIVGASVMAWLRRSWDAYWSWRAKRATLAILRALDQRTLNDLGVSASEIESTVYGRPGERLRCYDEAWWR